ncbi:MAG: hypothetical protein KDD06_12890, partial [Phaeodactylibacter sp.]|nr:hypothetical protein [Phaeodactylibacter sp.]
MGAILTWKEYVLGPIVLLILYLIAIRRKRRYKGTPIERYFMPALHLRFIGAFLNALMYQYYYGGGDTFLYYAGVSSLWDSFFQDPSLYFELVFRNPLEFSREALDFVFRYGHYRWSLYWFSVGPEAAVVKIGSLASLFAFKSYLGVSFVFSFFAFWGCWRLFKTFYYIYPSLHRRLAIAILFVPSVFFWGTGLMKDPLCLGAIGLLTHASYKLFILREKFWANSVIILICIFILKETKIYIVISFLPALLVWLSLAYRSRIRNNFLRIMATPFLFTVGLAAGLFLLMRVGSGAGKFSLSTALETVVVSQDYLKRQSIKAEGTYYDLGQMEPTIQSALSFFPKGVNVTLFRPYLWEVIKVINVPAAIESFLTLLLTLYVVFRTGPFRMLRAVFIDPQVLFCLTFSIIFAYAIGVSTYNYGSLVRYKIICMPFY